MKSGLNGFFERGGFVGFLPGDGGEIVNLAKMAVVGCFGVNRTEEVELPDNVGRFEAEDFVNRRQDLIVWNEAGAEGVNVHANRVRMSDGVSELDLRLTG